MMKNTKKTLSILSWATHGAYVLVCAMAILLMLLPVPELAGWLKDICVLLLMLTLGFSILFSIFFPLALFGLGFNISLLIAQIVDKTKKGQVVSHGNRCAQLSALPCPLCCGITLSRFSCGRQVGRERAAKGGFLW